MAKTIDQTKNMWEVNTQASKVWTVQRGDEVSIKLLSDEGELVWQTGSVMYAVKASDEEIELDSGSVAIRHIKDVKVQEESQQRAELRPIVSPSSIVNGNESERSPTRPVSGSFERREHQLAVDEHLDGTPGDRQAGLQLDLHDDALRSPWFQRADPSVEWHAWPDGQATEVKRGWRSGHH